jgi:DNA-binding CsgD family transcriptional regulator
MAMRTILVDIAPFVGMFRDVEILSYNSLQQMLQDQPEMVIHYFVAAQVLMDNMPYFAPQMRRCIVLTEGDDSSLPEGTRTVDIRRPEHELLKAFLMMHSNAHTGMPHPAPQEESELLSQREKDVLALIVKGYINKEIADMLNISTPTVIFHRRNLSEKIGSKSIGRQTIYAVMNGIVTPDEL